jgi:hypothetical protein
LDTLKKGAARLHAFLFASLCAVYYDYYSYEEEEEEEHKRRTQKKKKRKEKKRDILYIIIIIIIIIMPVPRGSLFGVPNENVKDKNEKHIQWDDDNLRENERTKSAKDIIDEPDTPWASPPPELFDSDAEEDEDVLEDEDLKNKRKTYAEEKIKERLERLEMTTRQSTGVAFVLETTTTTETSRSNFRSSDDNKEEEMKEKEDEDAILKSRLFEAQRKSLQCTYDRKRGTTFNKTSHPFVAQHREKEDDEEDKDEEEIKRELEALLNMQRKG